MELLAVWGEMSSIALTCIEQKDMDIGITFICIFKYMERENHVYIEIMLTCIFNYIDR